MKIEGDVSDIVRVETGMYSFDRSMENNKGRRGIPLMSSIEISGPTNTGKSTLTYSLAAYVAHSMGGDVALADFERFDPEFLIGVMEAQGFDNTLHYIQEENDEEALDRLVSTVREKCTVGIVDSVGAISPLAEIEGDIGEANMGRRARIMGQFIRKTTHMLKKNPTKMFICINHIHPKLGGLGTTTPGGETLKYLYAVQMKIWRKEKFSDGSYVIEGTITKNAFGYRDRKFWVVMLAGMGIHKGLTALWDCLMVYPKEFTLKSGIVKWGDDKKRMGGFLQAAKDGDETVFTPFIERLKMATDVVETDGEE